MGTKNTLPLSIDGGFLGLLELGYLVHVGRVVGVIRDALLT